MIGSQEVPPTGDDKTSIIVSMSNKPGALHELLVPFHDNGIDLTRIETRPSRSGKWTYVFLSTSSAITAIRWSKACSRKSVRKPWHSRCWALTRKRFCEALT